MNEKTRLGQTCLHLVTMNGKMSTIKMLLEEDIQIDAKDGNKRTALHVAVQAHKFEVVRTNTTVGQFNFT